MSNIEDKLQRSKLNIADGIKRRIYDWIAALIVVSLIASSLGAFGLIDFDTTNFAEFLISWFPYFAAAILLNTDLYKKGVFVAKNTTKFQAVINEYSGIANALSGSQIKALYTFCEQYNSEVKKTMREHILREEGLTYEDFDEGSEEVKKPLKTLSKDDLLSNGYSDNQIKAIRKAKNLKIKGINVNMLLSSIAASDITDIGDDERNLAKKQIVVSTVRYMLTTLLLSVIAIKNIYEWGWVGVILVIFKVAYLFAGCCMSYFKGYDDITINLVNHFTRKCDILKIYLNYEPEAVVMHDLEQ